MTAVGSYWLLIASRPAATRELGVFGGMQVDVDMDCLLNKSGEGKVRVSQTTLGLHRYGE